MKNKILLTREKIVYFPALLMNSDCGRCFVFQDGQYLSHLKGNIIDGSKLDLYISLADLYSATASIPLVPSAQYRLVGIKATIKPFSRYQVSYSGGVCAKLIEPLESFTIDPGVVPNINIKPIYETAELSPKFVRHHRLYSTEACYKYIRSTTSAGVDETFARNNFQRGACFYRLFSELELSSLPTEDLWIELKVYHDDSRNVNNYTWMSIQQLISHINVLKTDLKLPFNFTVTINGDDSSYHVKIDARNLTYIQVKFVLCWIRYAYEAPGSILLMDAYRLKTIYPLESVINLMLIPIQYFSRTNLSVRSDQCICIFGKFIRNVELSEKLSDPSRRYVNNLYEEFFLGPVLGKTWNYSQEEEYDAITPNGYLNRLPWYIQIYQQLR